MKLNINPDLKKIGIGANDIIEDAEKLSLKPEATPHDKILNQLLSQIRPIENII
jgi:hypothetical protein